MAFAVPDPGIGVLTNALVDVVTDVAVGDGNTTPTDADTALDNELFRTSVTDASNATQLSSDTIQLSIVVIGGDSVADGTVIEEIGAFSGSDMVYRETITPVTVGAGQSIQLQTNVTIDDIVAS
jgi:hypothetical protein